ncbi:hypothetical protein BZA05DRAFT_12398 [Tricharina praecox]|uniref:uncharacterized protein n=1 Tax=Tricharina praecox TaxID=43433 RepID=UPI00221EBC44|nr:uncharacterized protein BZA05DRAFT_12398 [Tricharina praecox]KAI5858744.1 hypothetical protein BZA05DRAFT_12398 [Tricharina praecox]
MTEHDAKFARWANWGKGGFAVPSSGHISNVLLHPPASSSRVRGRPVALGSRNEWRPVSGETHFPSIHRTMPPPQCIRHSVRFRLRSPAGIENPITPQPKGQHRNCAFDLLQQHASFHDAGRRGLDGEPYTQTRRSGRRRVRVGVQQQHQQQQQLQPFGLRTTGLESFVIVIGCSNLRISVFDTMKVVRALPPSRDVSGSPHAQGQFAFEP